MWVEHWRHSRDKILKIDRFKKKKEKNRTGCTFGDVDIWSLREISAINHSNNVACQMGVLFVYVTRYEPQLELGRIGANEGLCDHPQWLTLHHTRLGPNRFSSRLNPSNSHLSGTTFGRFFPHWLILIIEKQPKINYAFEFVVSIFINFASRLFISWHHRSTLGHPSRYTNSNYAFWISIRASSSSVTHMGLFVAWNCVSIVFVGCENCKYHTWEKYPFNFTRFEYEFELLFACADFQRENDIFHFAVGKGNRSLIVTKRGDREKQNHSSCCANIVLIDDVIGGRLVAKPVISNPLWSLAKWRRERNSYILRDKFHYLFILNQNTYACATIIVLALPRKKKKILKKRRSAKEALKKAYWSNCFANMVNYSILLAVLLFSGSAYCGKHYKGTYLYSMRTLTCTKYVQWFAE